MLSVKHRLKKYFESRIKTSLMSWRWPPTGPAVKKSFLLFLQDVSKYGWHSGVVVGTVASRIQSRGVDSHLRVCVHGVYLFSQCWVGFLWLRSHWFFNCSVCVSSSPVMDLHFLHGVRHLVPRVTMDWLQASRNPVRIKRYREREFLSFFLFFLLLK